MAGLTVGPGVEDHRVESSATPEESRLIQSLRSAVAAAPEDVPLRLRLHHAELPLDAAQHDAAVAHVAQHDAAVAHVARRARGPSRTRPSRCGLPRATRWAGLLPTLSTIWPDRRKTS